MPHLVLYHDFTSPFCRVALEVAVGAAATLRLDFSAAPFELRPPPAPLPAPDDPDLGEEIEAARPLARQMGVALDGLRVIPRTRKAHEAVAHAREHGREVPVLRALYEALWRDGADIGRIDVIADVAASAGLEREPLHVALGLDQRQAEVAEAQRAAETGGVTGVPTLRLEDRILVGLLPPDDVLAWARSAAS